MPQETVLDVLRSKGLLEESIVDEIDLSGGEIVGGTEVPLQAPQILILPTRDELRRSSGPPRVVLSSHPVAPPLLSPDVEMA